VLRNLVKCRIDSVVLGYSKLPGEVCVVHGPKLTAARNLEDIHVIGKRASKELKGSRVNKVMLNLVLKTVT
jgi:hypothetical protein